MPFSAPSSSGISGTVLLAVILSVVVVFALACVLAWRHTRHRLSFDAWGLPVRTLVRTRPLHNTSTRQRVATRERAQRIWLFKS